MFWNLRELWWQSKASLLMDLRSAGKNLTAGTISCGFGTRMPVPNPVLEQSTLWYLGWGWLCFCSPEPFREQSSWATRKSCSTKGFVFPVRLRASGMFQLLWGADEISNKTWMNPVHLRKCNLLTGLFCFVGFFSPLSPIHIDQLLSLTGLLVEEAVQQRDF